MTVKTARRQLWWVSLLALAGIVMLVAVGPFAADDTAPPATSTDTESSQSEAPAQVVVPPFVNAEELTDEQQKQQEKMMQDLLRQAEEARQRQEEELRKTMASPQWRPSHRETAVIEVEGRSLNTFCLNNDGNILAGCGGPSVDWVADPDSPGEVRMQRTAGNAEIRVYSPEGSLLQTWKVEIKPEAIAVAKDGTIFVGGDGQVARLDQTGNVLAVADSPVVAVHKQEQEKKADERQASEEAEKQNAEKAAEKKPKTSAFRALFNIVVGSEEVDEVQMAAQQTAAMQERIRGVSGIAVTGDDVFVCCPMSEGYGFAIWRTDREFQNPEEIVTKLRGCCGQMDISSFGSDVFVCENSRKRVTRYDREGKAISHFGKASRSGPEGFGSCCNPMNLCFAANGDVITSESGPPDAVKRFTQDGELVSVLALPKFDGGCLRVTTAMSPDERKVYVLNTSKNTIHVFADRRYEPTHEQVTEIQLKSNGQPAGLHTFCATADGKLLAACGGKRVSYVRSATGTEAKTIEETSEIRVLSLDGETLERWPVKFMPQAVNVAPNGTVFVGGEGQLLKLSPAGEVLLAADAPNRQNLKELMANIDEAVAARKKQYQDQATRYKEMADKCAAQLADGKRNGKDLTAVEKAQLESQQKNYQRYAEMMEQQMPRAKELVIMSAKSKMKVSGVAATDKDVFVCCSAVQGYGFDVYRMTHDLTDAKKIVEGLRGCCGQMDIQASDGDVWAAENSRGRVVRFDREGKEVASWGKKDRKSVEGFGSCCNPMNLWFGADGVVYTAEASIGRIKRFTPDGKFLGLVGTAGVVPGCKNVAITVSPDGKTVCMLDITRSKINVFQERKEEVADESVAQEVEIEVQPSAFGGIF